MFTSAAVTRTSLGVVPHALGKFRVQGQGQARRRGLSSQPIPGDLRQTVDRYLAYVRPLVTEDQFTRTEQLSEQFLKGPGPDLQHLFQKFAQEHTNWMSYTSVKMNHLCERKSLAMFTAASSFRAFNHVRDLQGQLWCAAQVVSGVLDLKQKLNDGHMEQRVGGQDQCMSCFQYMFSSCRVPATPCDRFIVYPSSPPATRHITVLYNNQIFSVDVYGQGGGVLSTEQLYEQLRAVTEHACGAEDPVGVLTALHRDSWACVYHDLVQDENNRAVMDNIQRSFFVLSLDQPIPASTHTPSPTTTTTIQDTEAHRIFNGGGVDLNSCNRWLDKTFQVIVGADGTQAVQSEHAGMDGTHVMFIISYLLDFLRAPGFEGHISSGIPSSQLKPPRKLQLNLTAKALSAIGDAKQIVTSFVEDLNTTSFTMHGVGTKELKGWSLSPDSFIQLAFQLAYYRIHRRPCGALEYVSKRCHHLGRLDVVRCTTPESLAFVRHMDSPDVSDKAKLRHLTQAIDAHKRHVRDVTSGYSIDSHFQALEFVALQHGFPLPQLFHDPSFQRAFQFHVSSSQLVCKDDAVTYYAPEEADGYSCPYVPHDDRINFSITTNRNHLHYSTFDLFAHNVVASMLDMRLLVAGQHVHHQPQQTHKK